MYEMWVSRPIYYNYYNIFILWITVNIINAKMFQKPSLWVKK